MNVEIGTEAAQFPEKEYITWILFAVYEYISWKSLLIRVYTLNERIKFFVSSLLFIN